MYAIGRGVEQALATEVLAILSIHLGGSGDEGMLYTQLKTYMKTLILDASSSIIARAKVSNNPDQRFIVVLIDFWLKARPIF